MLSGHGTSMFTLNVTCMAIPYKIELLGLAMYIYCYHDLQCND